MHAGLGVVWGKSKAQNSAHLLLGHLLDTAAVGELVWDRFLSSAVKDRLDAHSGGRGRLFFSLLCGLHDVGKATPAFQMKDDALAERVRVAGLDWRRLTRNQSRQWHHARAGAVIMRTYTAEAGWPRETRNWVWPLIAGHHGIVPATATLQPPTPSAHGEGPWREAQRAFVAMVARELGTDLTSFVNVSRPRRAGQLALSGLIIMADWIASDETHFEGQPSLEKISLEESRRRAETAWTSLGLRGGWRSSHPAPRTEKDLVRLRFGRSARPTQAAAVALAEEMPAPGLMIIEAPMGEGKTEAALVTAEVMARRFGADGVFVGMPTQATSDPMFTRVLDWLTKVDPEVPIGLLHGRARFNKEWAALRREARFTGIDEGLDEYGLPDDFGWASAGNGSGPAAEPAASGEAAPDWFLGGKRGLLTPVTVGTVDQLLYAATRTKHVMLRHAGLAGRVVILDEVHAYDVYMAQFLFEALRWLADAGVPVILLSATLPPALRLRLIEAYVQGVTQNPDPELGSIPAANGYPCLTAVAVGNDGGLDARVTSGASWRDRPSDVRVEILAETVEFAPTSIADAVTAEVADGGRALVVCNTVRRAQDVFDLLRPVFGADVVLLHARFVATARAERAERIVDQLGPPGRSGAAERPRRLVVVATQVAEQSFDVDADLLVSDLAPIDLLIQRVGRLHRHVRPDVDRPHRLRQPRLIVSGLRLDATSLPSWPAGSRAVYGDHPLVRAAALVLDAVAGPGWSIPAQVPALVADGYGEHPLGPPSWTAAAERYRQDWLDKETERAAKAANYLLAGVDALGAKTLDGLHDRSAAPREDDERIAAVVRDGPESVEVVLVRRAPDGGLRTLAGRPLGPNGEAVNGDDALLEEVVGATIRLPPIEAITAAARAELGPLPGWSRDDPWLRHARALVLDDKLSVAFGKYLLTYDNDHGLRYQRQGER